MSVVGSCKLCRSDGVELQVSHLLPAFVYKKIRRSSGANNSLVVMSKDSFRFTDNQITDHVLCGACEQRFGEVEDRVSRQCFQDDGSFPLLNALLGQPPLNDDPDVRAIAGKMAGIDVERFAYFASSILWRAGSHVWGQVPIG